MFAAWTTRVDISSAFEQIDERVLVEVAEYVGYLHAAERAVPVLGRGKVNHPRRDVWFLGSVKSLSNDDKSSGHVETIDLVNNRKKGQSSRRAPYLRASGQSRPRGS